MRFTFHKIFRVSRRQVSVRGLFVLWISLTLSATRAQIPILPDFHADPSARIFNGKLYLYPSHDAVGATNWKSMVDWHVFSSDDMVKWTDHGVAFSLKDISWAKEEAWAPDCIGRNGKYYFYFPAGGQIGVAVSDSPTGPFKDALGQPLIRKGEAGIRYTIDPNVFIDDDGQAYLYVGGGRQLGVVKLKSDMVTCAGPIQILDMPKFYEGVWVHKRNGIYFASYPTRPQGKSSQANVMVYSTAKSPLGPWEYQGEILDNHSGNIHGSITEFKGQSYLFYHVAGPSNWERRVCVERVAYNYDGMIKPMQMTPAVRAVPAAVMQRVYDEVKTPFKHGIVLDPPPGKKLDCPNVFRHGDKWFMLYVQFEPKPAEGYTTQLAVSDDLLRWKPLGTALDRGADGAWDHANAAAGVALFDSQWSGSNTLGQHDGRYWLSYIGGSKFGYEQPPLAIGLATAADPSRPAAWTKLPASVLKPDDADASPFESETLYKSHIIRDDTRALGAPFVMFYNAKPKDGDERIFAAVSDDMKTWRRFGAEAVVANARPPGLKHNVISGDPQVVRMGDLWVMFYFGAFWKPGAFDTFACSYDLVHWTKWSGPHLIQASESFDTPYAHKPWLIKHDGVVYHFYCAVGGKDTHRAIAVATSKEIK